MMLVSSVSLPERLSPDGGEDSEETTFTQDINDVVQIDTESYDITQENKMHDSILSKPKLNASLTKNTSAVEVLNIEKSKIKPSRKNTTYTCSRQVEEDLSTLDVKCSRSKHDAQFDDIELIFKDMEPKISRTAIMKIPVTNETTKNKFRATEIDGDNFDGWGDEINDEWIGFDVED